MQSLSRNLCRDGVTASTGHNSASQQAKLPALWLCILDWFDHYFYNTFPPNSSPWLPFARNYSEQSGWREKSSAGVLKGVLIWDKWRGMSKVIPEGKKYSRMHQRRRTEEKNGIENKDRVAMLNSSQIFVHYLQNDVVEAILNNQINSGVISLVNH